MAKSQSNVAKIVVDSISVMDTLTGDGVTAIATATAAGASTVTVTGLTATLNQYAGMDIVVYSGTGSPQIRTIASNSATSVGSTTITVGVAWTVNPGVGALMQVAPSATWVNLGIMGEVPMKIEMKDVAPIALSDGSQLQKGYNMTLESELLQLLDASTIEGYKNKNVWLKLNPSAASSNTIIIRNVLLGVESSIDLSIKGKGAMNLKSVKYIQSLSDAIVIG